MPEPTQPATMPAQNDPTIDTLSRLISEAEKVLAQGGEKASDEISSLRDRLHSALEDTKASARRATDFARAQAAKADHFVHDRPYVAAGIAALLGLAVGVAISRQCCSRRNT